MIEMRSSFPDVRGDSDMVGTKVVFLVAVVRQVVLEQSSGSFRCRAVGYQAGHDRGSCVCNQVGAECGHARNRKRMWQHLDVARKESIPNSRDGLTREATDVREEQAHGACSQ